MPIDAYQPPFQRRSSTFGLVNMVLSVFPKSVKKTNPSISTLYQTLSAKKALHKPHVPACVDTHQVTPKGKVSPGCNP